jgi:thiol:disulfide interchange protein
VYVLSLMGAGITYGWVVYDGIVTHHWMHPFTLHPVFAYVIAAFLAWRHRRRRGMLQLTAAVIAVLGVGGIGLFLTYYTPTAPTRTKAVTILFVPLVQMFAMGGLAVWLEFCRHAQRAKNTEATATSDRPNVVGNDANTTAESGKPADTSEASAPASLPS